MVELNVNMHCEACAEQLKRKILKMRGVRTVTTELSSGKVMVTGTMEANRLVDYVYRCTKKLAKIVPQPESEKPAEAEPKPEDKKEAEKSAEEPKPEDKKEGEAAAKKECDEKPPEEEKKEGGKGNSDEKNSTDEAKKEGEEQNTNIVDEHSMQRMVYHYPSFYMIERIPPPQLFSDENPNACCIT